MQREGETHESGGLRRVIVPERGHGDGEIVTMFRMMQAQQEQQQLWLRDQHEEQRRRREEQERGQDEQRRMLQVQ